jgi:hypothetical protein
MADAELQEVKREVNYRHGRKPDKHGCYIHAPMEHYPDAHLYMRESEIAWTRFTKRTDDPKLAWLELTLTQRGIPSRRKGYSFHGPILEIPARHLDEAWEFLSQPFDESGVSVDDMPDDAPCFAEDAH